MLQSWSVWCWRFHSSSAHFDGAVGHRIASVVLVRHLHLLLRSHDVVMKIIMTLFRFTATSGSFNIKSSPIFGVGLCFYGGSHRDFGPFLDVVDGRVRNTLIRLRLHPRQTHTHTQAVSQWLIVSHLRHVTEVSPLVGAPPHWTCPPQGWSCVDVFAHINGSGRKKSCFLNSFSRFTPNNCVDQTTFVLVLLIFLDDSALVS